jgi:hypothetical protein
MGLQFKHIEVIHLNRTGDNDWACRITFCRPDGEIFYGRPQISSNPIGAIWKAIIESFRRWREEDLQLLD